jgi:diaminopropionate ammonia-lyase
MNPSHVAADGHGSVSVRRRSFHQLLPEFAATPLHASTALADFVGVESVLVKDERCRLGLPSFKILGASWAAVRSLQARGLKGIPTIGSIRAFAADNEPLVFVTATDGNHGRAVAHIARVFGAEAMILLPSAISHARADSIREEGAVVVRISGSYEDAVEAAQKLTDLSANAVLVADTSSDSDEGPGDWVIEGYTTIFEELEEQLEAHPSVTAAETLIAIPAGVGALAAACIRHVANSPLLAQSRLITVEPDSAACVKAAVERGEPVRLANAHTSVMATLNAGQVSTAAWPYLATGLEAAVSVSDDQLVEALRALARHDLDCGESGAASIAGARAFVAGLPKSRSPRRVIALLTEGVTDPDLHRRLLAEPDVASTA